MFRTKSSSRPAGRRGRRGRGSSGSRGRRRAGACPAATTEAKTSTSTMAAIGSDTVSARTSSFSDCCRGVRGDRADSRSARSLVAGRWGDQTARMSSTLSTDSSSVMSSPTTHVGRVAVRADEPVVAGLGEADHAVDARIGGDRGEGRRDRRLELAGARRPRRRRRSGTGRSIELRPAPNSVSSRSRPTADFGVRVEPAAGARGHRRSARRASASATARSDGQDEDGSAEAIDERAPAMRTSDGQPSCVGRRGLGATTWVDDRE